MDSDALLRQKRTKALALPVAVDTGAAPTPSRANTDHHSHRKSAAAKAFSMAGAQVGTPNAVNTLPRQPPRKKLTQTFFVRPHSFSTCVQMTGYAADHLSDQGSELGPGGFFMRRCGIPGPARNLNNMPSLGQGEKKRWNDL